MGTLERQGLYFNKNWTLCFGCGESLTSRTENVIIFSRRYSALFVVYKGDSSSSTPLRLFVVPSGISFILPSNVGILITPSSAIRLKYPAEVSAEVSEMIGLLDMMHSHQRVS